MKYPNFIGPANTMDWCSADIIVWCQKNLGLNCSVDWIRLTQEFGFDYPIYVDSYGIAGVPLHSDSFVHVMFFGAGPAGETITKFYFRDVRYAVLAKMAT